MPEKLLDLFEQTAWPFGRHRGAPGRSGILFFRCDGGDLIRRRPLAPFFEPLEDGEEGGDEDYGEAGRSDHAAEDADAKRASRICACTCRKDQR